MEKRYSEIIGMPVLVEDVRRPICRVCEMVVDPENGNIVAFCADTRCERVIAARDVIQFGQHLLIRDVDDICEAADILRVSEIKKRGVKIMRNRVETVKGEYLGKVYDYAVDTKIGKLKKIFVAKSVLGILRVDDRIISSKYIVLIEAEKIVVKDIIATIPIEELYEEVKMEEEFSGV